MLSAKLIVNCGTAAPAAAAASAAAASSAATGTRQMVRPLANQK